MLAAVSLISVPRDDTGLSFGAFSIGAIPGRAEVQAEARSRQSQDPSRVEVVVKTVQIIENIRDSARHNGGQGGRWVSEFPESFTILAAVAWFQLGAEFLTGVVPGRVYMPAFINYNY